MRLRFFFLVFFSLHLGGASQALCADANESPPANGAAVDRANTETAVAAEVKGAPVAAYDWTGAYVGGHVGYGWGSSHWTAHDAAGPNLNGSLDFYKGFDFSKGTGSFFGGFQAGYNTMLPSHLVLGIEGDVSFPNTIKATQQISSPSLGQASYGEMVQYFGTVRGRIGYPFRNWLIYGIGGFAWTYDQFARVQIAGTPT